MRHLGFLRTIRLPRQPGTGPVRDRCRSSQHDDPCPAYSIVVLHPSIASLAPVDRHSPSRARRYAEPRPSHRAHLRNHPPPASAAFGCMDVYVRPEPTDKNVKDPFHLTPVSLKTTFAPPVRFPARALDLRTTTVAGAACSGAAIQAVPSRSAADSTRSADDRRMTAIGTIHPQRPSARFEAYRPPRRPANCGPITASEGRGSVRQSLMVGHSTPRYDAPKCLP